jgi:hypothetical protein
MNDPRELFAFFLSLGGLAIFDNNFCVEIAFTDLEAPTFYEILNIEFQ